MEHSKGPWVIGYANMSDPETEDGEPEGFDILPDDSVWPIVEGIVKESDALLISAAPDLLDACEALLESFDKSCCYVPEEDEDDNHFVVMARAAVKKAKGEK